MTGSGGSIPTGPSEGLLQRLEELRDDGTPRGLAWGMTVDMLLAAAPMATTDEEVEMANQALVAAISAADDYALREVEMGLHVQCLEEILEKQRSGEAQ